MGAAASACCTRRSPDFGIDEVPPEQIGREVSQFSAEVGPFSANSFTKRGLKHIILKAAPVCSGLCGPWRY
eukprot:3545165-Amphidinium_carterae.1